MNKIKQENKFYKWKRTLSYNALFHLIITERGFGKTYGFLILTLKWCFYKNKKGIILTKYVNELDTYSIEIFATYQKILTDENVKDFEGLELELKLEKNHIYLNDKILVSFYAINHAERMKKITALKEYDYIAHDEFLTLGQYVPNETDKVLTIYDTVDRRKNTTKLFLMGNALSRYNPYSEDWGLPVNVNGFCYLKKRRFLIHISNDLEYQQQRLLSAVTKLAGEDSEYLKMANKNVFVYDVDDFVVELSKKQILSHKFSLLINEKVYTLSLFADGFYIHSLVKMAKIFHNKRPNKRSVKLTRDMKKQLQSIYFSSMLYYENIDVKVNFIKEFIKE